MCHETMIGRSLQAVLRCSLFLLLGLARLVRPRQRMVLVAGELHVTYDGIDEKTR